MISQGRGSLVSTFSCFNYLTLNSLFQFVGTVYLHLLETSNSGTQLIFEDLLSLLLVYSMSAVKSNRKLTNNKPPSGLLSLDVLYSVFSIIFFFVVFSLINFQILMDQPFFVKASELRTFEELQKINVSCYENNVN